MVRIRKPSLKAILGHGKALLAGVALTAAAGLCQNLGPLPPAPAAAEAVKGESTVARWLKPYFREGRYRWLDIADQPYSATFRRLFKYSGRQVLAKYAPVGETLRGELVAHGLKPNFAYQVKLEGQPPAPGHEKLNEAARQRDWTNRQLSHVGRSWCVDCGYNISSWGLGSGYHKGHRVLGYLLVDFFVTDHNGSARCEFAVNGSYHVLWKTSQYPPSADDAPPRSFKPVATRAYGYDEDLPAKEIAIYLEQEYDRPHTGELKLPEGEYRCQLLLTEESFHSYSWSSDDDPGGHWCHALSDEALQFTIRR